MFELSLMWNCAQIHAVRHAFLKGTLAAVLVLLEEIVYDKNPTLFIDEILLLHDLSHLNEDAVTLGRLTCWFGGSWNIGECRSRTDDAYRFVMIY